ncbi:hypothetical protein ElyMa_005505200 [Elysia marginata]|uniref:Uncharacterized protein n=1 Tax=Elysia marginata TaxID=1093978 RepID=A0AAV4EUB0_9GAST|nr:hypothetical protein ElyMa_005505200 [Elysia marginata]
MYWTLSVGPRVAITQKICALELVEGTSGMYWTLSVGSRVAKTQKICALQLVEGTSGMYWTLSVESRVAKTQKICALQLVEGTSGIYWTLSVESRVAKTQKICALQLVEDIQTVIGKHFKNKFRDDQINDLEAFQGDARDLNNPITTNEVEKTLARLNNNRACGEDGIPVELINTALIHSLRILEARWRLFGLILRQAINTPPDVAMTKYFKTEESKRGRPKTSIWTTLRRDLKSHNSDQWPTRLHSIKDLDHLRDIAQNRSDWKHLTTAIYRSAQEETSVDVAAYGH